MLIVNVNFSISSNGVKGDGNIELVLFSLFGVWGLIC